MHSESTLRWRKLQELKYTYEFWWYTCMVMWLSNLTCEMTIFWDTTKFFFVDIEFLLIYMFQTYHLPEQKNLDSHGNSPSFSEPISQSIPTFHFTLKSVMAQRELKTIPYRNCHVKFWSSAQSFWFTIFNSHDNVQFQFKLLSTEIQIEF